MNTTTENYCIDCKHVAASDCESRGHIVGTLGVDTGTPAPQTINPYGDELCATCGYAIDSEGLCIMDVSHVTPAPVATTEEWRVDDKYVMRDGQQIGSFITAELAAQSVSDHRLAALVPQLQEVLRAVPLLIEAAKGIRNVHTWRGSVGYKSALADAVAEIDAALNGIDQEAIYAAIATAKGATE